MKHIEKIFAENGGEFLTSAEDMVEKLKKIRAYIFDWDGVFNNGEKAEHGSSIFSEVDSMGTNLMRFSHWLQHEELPYTAVISGERNAAAFWFCNREHFSASFYKIAHKIEALDHICQHHGLKHEEVAFVFDDVLDLSIAKVCGLRLMVNHLATPLFTRYVKENGLADYITGRGSGNYAVRECCELLMGLSGTYDTVISKRSEYDLVYKEYARARNEVTTSYFTKTENGIVEQQPK